MRWGKELSKRLLISIQKKRLNYEPNLRPRILSYHSVSNSDWNFSVNPKRFEQHLDYLKKNFEVIHLEELVEGIENRKNMNRKISITFDDGHKDNITNALPLLEKYGMKATFYITVNYIEREPISSSLSFPKNPMNWDEVKDLKRKGHEIGSHTLTHKNLLNLNNNELSREILFSKKKIEDELNEEIQSIAYPFGKFPKKAKEIVKREYNWGCSVMGGYEDISQPPIDLFDLRRTPVNDVSLLNFKHIVNGFYDLIFQVGERVYRG